MNWSMVRHWSWVPRLKLALWSLQNPGSSFKQFYAESVASALSGEKSHSSLGPNLKPGRIAEARRTFSKLVKKGIRPSDTLVDYGCGTLRLGALFIEFLEPNRYIGLDVDERILAIGRNQFSAELMDSKRPVLEVISPESLRRAAARQPRWVCSKGVLQHIPPEELNEYFESLSYLIHVGAIGFIYARIAEKSKRHSAKTWLHEFNHLKTAANRNGMEVDRIAKGLITVRTSK
jgi:SAM-dependent methyltransferase